MNHNLTEAQLTAYVLGELPADERARVEAAMQADPAVAAEVARLRKTAGYLRESLGKDPALRLSPERRAALLARAGTAAAGRGGMPAWLRGLFRPVVWGPAVAVGLVLLVVWQGGVPKATSPVAERADALSAVDERAAKPAAAEPVVQEPAAAPAVQTPAAVQEESFAPAKPDRPAALPPALAKGALAPAAPSVQEGDVAEAPAPAAAAAPPAEAEVAGLARREVAPAAERAFVGDAALKAQSAEAPAPKRTEPAQGYGGAARAKKESVVIFHGEAAIDLRLPEGVGSPREVQALREKLSRLLAAAEAKDAPGAKVEASAARDGATCLVTARLRRGDDVLAEKKAATACTVEAIGRKMESLVRELVR